MSTATQETFQGFAEASVQKIPTLACVGYVDEVGEGKLSESQNYVVQPITIRPYGPGRTVVHRILYRPEWLESNFNPDSLSEYGDDGAKMLSVYRRNINVKGGISALKGLAGSEEAFKALAAKLLSLTDKSIPSVSSAIRDFFTANKESENPIQVGYVLRQRKDKAGEDENGKQQYELANGYEVAEFFFDTADARKKLKQRATRSKDGSFKIAFDEDGE